MKSKKITAIILAVVLVLSFVGCNTAQIGSSDATILQTSDTGTITTGTTTVVSSDTSTAVLGEIISSEDASSVVLSAEDSVLDTSEMFTSRDIEQTVDATEAIFITLEDRTDVTISEEGIYIISGDVENTTIVVEADNEAKVQLVLDEVSIVNEDAPAIYIKTADKVFITTYSSSNYMEVTGNYESDGDTNLDAVIFSKDDLVLNGLGTLEIVSVKGNGITSKDDLKITGGTYQITALDDGIEANDSIRIYDGDIMIVSDKDAIHSENEDDTSLGYIYILSGTLNINAADDAIRGTSIIQIDGGTINIEKSSEGIEATYIQINGGDISIYATDDGINATAKSSYEVAIEVNGGTIDISMASGDTDAFDSNGVIIINGGIIDLTCGSSFDANVSAVLNGGDVTVNGEEITEITVSQQGGFKRR